MVEHILKTWPIYFDAVKRGDKTFEVRRDDRGFQKGDVVRLRRYDPTIAEVLQPSHSEELVFRIGWILSGGQFGIEPGYVCFSLHPREGE